MKKGPEYLGSPSKRAQDIAIASLISPAVAALWLPMRHISKQYCNEGGSYLMSQARIGRNENSFALRKFRTLYEDAVSGKPDVQQVIDSRTDRFGRKIRTLGVDETAQILNIFSGDMSFIGPRPLLADDVELFMHNVRDKPLANDWQEIRTLARPGIIGPGQMHIHHKQAEDAPISRELQMRQDIDYVENATFMKDMQLLTQLPSDVIRLGRLALA